MQPFFGSSLWGRVAGQHICGMFVSETSVTKDGCVVDYMTTLPIKESPCLVLHGQIIISQNKLNCSEAKTT